MYRYRYVNTGPVVFTQEVVNGKTWQPEPGEEADFDHPIEHPFLLLVSSDATVDPPVVEPVAPVETVTEPEPSVEPPAEPVVATESDAAASGEVE